MKHPTPEDPSHIEGLPVKGLLESFGSVDPARAGPPQSRDNAPAQIANYEILDEIDRGGMGIVYRARDERLDRIVAIKVMQAGNFAGEDLLARFQNEAQILGQLDHPNIVPVFDVGEEEGQPFLAMKYIDGGSLDGAISRFTGDSQKVVDVMLKVARAVDEAHRRGVLHRDLKPANVLLDSDGQPHISDFGLSRRVESDSSLTMDGSVMGSPHYISPESATATGELTTAADIYGLGAILFHLLTGRPPYEGESTIEILKLVSQGDPPVPRSIRKDVDRDLETICLKCLRRDPGQRYLSAGALAEELERWKRGEPVHARSASSIERGVKWARRHPVGTVGIMAAILLIGGFVVLNALHQMDLTESRDLAVAASEKAQESEAALGETVVKLLLERADQELVNGSQRAGIAHLLDALERAPESRLAAERLVHEWEHRNFPLEVGDPIDLPFSVSQMSWSGDGRYLACSGQGVVEVLDVVARKKVIKPLNLNARIKSIDFNFDGSRLLIQTGKNLMIWDIESQKSVAGVTAPKTEMADAAMEESGKRFFVALGPTVAVRQTSDSALIQRLRLPGRSVVSQIDVSPSGDRIVAVGGKTITWWDGASLELLGTGATDFVIDTVSFSADGTGLIVTGHKNYQIWNSETCQADGDAVVESASVTGAVLGQDASWHVVNHVTGRFKMWSSASRPALMNSFQTDGHAMVAAVRPGEGRTMVTATDEGKIQFWNLDPGPAIRARNTVLNTKDSADVKYIATLTSFDSERSVRFQRNNKYQGHESTLDTRREIETDGSFWDADVSPDGSEVALVTLKSRQATVEIRSVETLERLFVVDQGPGRRFLHRDPAGNILIVTGEIQGLVIWDCRSNSVKCRNPDFPGARRIAISDDGKSFLSGNASGKVNRWSTETGKRMSRVVDHGSRVLSVAMGPGEKEIITGGQDRKVCWWEISPGEPDARLVGESVFPGIVNWVQVSPQGGQRFLAGCRDGSFRVWEMESKKMLCEVDAYELPVNHIGFTPDGLHVLSICMDGTARIWDADSGYPVTKPFRHDEWWECPKVQFPLDPDWLEEVRHQCRLKR